MDSYFLAQEGKLTDFTIVEQSEVDEKIHRIHSVIAYGQSKFLQYIVDRGLNKITITVPQIGFLDLIIKAIYYRDTAQSIYDSYISDSSPDVAMQLFDIANYMQLITHIEYIASAIENHIDIEDILDIYISRTNNGLLIQDEIIDILKKGIMDEYMVKVRDNLYIKHSFTKHPYFPLIQHLLPV